MQYRVLDRQSLKFVDSGACFDYNIDNDYIVGNNSTVKIVKSTEARQGDFIALIETSGAYSFGCITAVDNSDLKISYKHAKECLNDNVLNPVRYNYIDNTTFVGKYDAVKDTARLIKANWIDCADPLHKLPLQLEISGQTTSVWTWKDDDLDFNEYLLNIFNTDNVVLQFQVNFSEKTPKLLCRIMANNNSGEVIKDNIKLMSITFTEEKLPEKTVAIVLDNKTKQILGTYYLRDNNTVTTSSELVVDGAYRLLPVKTVVVEHDSSNSDGVTPIETAYEELKGTVYNHTIEIKLDKKSMILDYRTLQIGDGVKIVNANGITDTIYTGYRDDGTGSVTMVFGKLRKRYTDKIQMLLRRKR